jgi:hypothetical protein
VLAASLPFAAIKPILSTPWGALTDDRALILIALAAWVGVARWPTERELRALGPTLALFAVSVVSAALAPAYADESLKSLWRLVAAGLMFLFVLRLAPYQRTSLLWAVLVGAGVSALLGLGEAVGMPVVQSFLSTFKVAPTTVGGHLRVSASFQYATIAAMYFEMVAPLALALAATTSRRWTAVLATAIAALCTANVVLSLTRAGILTLTVVYGVLLLCGWLDRRLRRVWWPTLVSASVLVGGVLWLTARDPIFGLRLVSENDADWYGAAYIAPAALDLEPNQTASVAVDVRNEGRIVWSSAATDHPFALGYRWLTADASGVLDLAPGEVALPHDVAPGETVHLEATVGVPNLPAGAYRLDWGMVQRDVVQFYERGWSTAQTSVTIARAEPGGSLPPVIARDDTEAPWVVPRLDLWRAAVHLFAARPVLGIGFDNFRHLYGVELGLDSWDERVQANNLYLEVLVDTGILGLAAFAWLVARPLVDAVRALRGKANYVALGAALGVVAFLVHGLLDVFLTFTPTVLLFWLLLATLMAQKPQVSGR